MRPVQISKILSMPFRHVFVFYYERHAVGVVASHVTLMVGMSSRVTVIYYNAISAATLKDKKWK